VGKKLYVGNLSYQVDNAALEKEFAAHGTVESINIITDRATGQSKGFGFIEMSSETEAKAAIAALDGAELGGRIIKVATANPPRQRSGRGGGFGHGRRGGSGGSGGGGGGRFGQRRY
jgi:cold-inducible RNA-binding protein